MITRSATGAIDPTSITTRQEFAAALTAVREDAGLTVRQVARAAAINPSTAGGYFGGRHLPPLRPQGSVRSILAACSITDPAQVAAWEQALARVRRPPGPRPAALPPPYRGLASYTTQDADWFFGRDDEAAALHRQLDAARADGGLVMLLGAAGSGKTSLLAAGLLPRLQHGLAVHPLAWLTPGSDPLRSLATALATLTDGDPVELATRLRADPLAAREVARHAVPPSGGRVIALPREDRPLDRPGQGDLADRLEPSERAERDLPGGPDPYPVIVVDQLEELFVRCQDTVLQHAFVTALAALTRPARDGGPAAAVVVTSLRTQFLPEAARYPDLVAALQGDPVGSALQLRPMTKPQLRSVILDPARKAGLDLDDGLLDLVLADLTCTPEPVLPRLSHALRVTWRRGQRSRLAVVDYREAGGTRGALQAGAEAAYLALPDAARQAAPAVFAAAAGRTCGTPPTDDAPDPSAAAAVERVYLDAGLLAVDADGLRLVSDVLIDCWPRLRDWLPGEADHDPRAGGSQRAGWPVNGAARAGTGRAGTGRSGPGRSGPGRSGPGRSMAARVEPWWAWRGAVLAALLLVAVLAGVWTTLH